MTAPAHDASAEDAASSAPRVPHRAPGGGDAPRRVSFEFFPPEPGRAEESWWRAVGRLAPLGPAFTSVTCGAGGSVRGRTRASVARLRGEAGLEAAAHMTCAGVSRARVERDARAYARDGVTHIVALRGDMPGMGAYRQRRDGFGSTAEMIAALRRIAPFEISVSAYPERHPDSPSQDHDLDVLRSKAAQGATRAITQFCFDAGRIARCRDKVAAAGVDIGLVPGIMPVGSLAGLVRMAGKCGACVPGWLKARFAECGGDPVRHRQTAAGVAADQCRALLAEGFTEFHFYTLNRSEPTRAVCLALGLGARPQGACAAGQGPAP